MENAEQVVYERLKNAIYKRYIRPNTKLVEAKIAEQLGVSRTPVRGAIKRLAHDGFVKLSQNRSASIIKPTIKEIRETFTVRLCLEKMAVKLAAESIKQSDIKNLENLLSQETKTFNQKNIGVYYNFNYNFHIAIATITGNNILKEYLSSIINRSQVYLILYENFYQMTDNPSLKEHQAIVMALKTGDANLCGKLVDQHIQATLDGISIEGKDAELPEDYISL